MRVGEPGHLTTALGSEQELFRLAIEAGSIAAARVLRSNC